jgi:glycine/D-amino acid oxidase-like deaminating enzyme
MIVGGLAAWRRGCDLDHTKRTLSRRMKWVFPHLGDLDWRWFWHGDLAVNTETLPKIYELAPGVVAALGYSGRGVPAATAMGQVLADFTSGIPAEELDLAVSNLRPIYGRRVLSFLVSRFRGVVNRGRDRIEAVRARVPAPWF